MNNSKHISFIIGSGRCGTRSLYRMFAGETDVDIHHEYKTIDVQQISVLYYSKKISFDEACDRIKKIYDPAIYYSDGNVWIDSSNKCSWIVDVLHSLYPNAKFLSLIRDGRNVVSSFYYKLREEMYDDKSTKILTEWLSGTTDVMPPAEKPYWWNIPIHDKVKYEKFKEYNRFERVCFHWYEINKHIGDSFKKLPKKQTMFIRFEDLIKDDQVIINVCDFLNIGLNKMFFEFLKKPRNVFYPLDYQLSKEKMILFDQICKDMMDEWKYMNSNQYSVEY